MQLPRLIAFSILILLLTACGSSEKKPPTVGESRSFSEVCDKGNEGKRVAVEGYLRLPSETKQKYGMVLRLYPTTDFDGTPVGVSVDVGGKPNQAATLPKEYRDTDLKVTLNNGEVANFGMKVKVSGDMYFPLVGQEFKCALSNPLIELSK